MSRFRKRDPSESIQPSLILEAGEILDRFEVGNWIPNVDLCETPGAVVIRVEVPGINPGDIQLTVRSNVLRVQGIKREPKAVRERISYYCLERRYGKFDRQITIEGVVDVGRAAASLVNGILTVEIPKIKNRRDQLFEIPVKRASRGDGKG